VEGDPDNPKDQVIIGTECIKKCKITPEKSEDRTMGTMRQLMERIEEAMFGGAYGGGKASSRAAAMARDKADAARAAKRRGEYTWNVDLRGKDDDPGASNEATLSNQYGKVAWITWWDDDEARDKFRAETTVPGVRGQSRVIGRFSSLDKAKAAVEKELGL
jgi:hypothetical protein